VVLRDVVRSTRVKFEIVMIYNVAARRHNVDVLLSNSTFLILVVLVV